MNKMSETFIMKMFADMEARLKALENPTATVLALVEEPEADDGTDPRNTGTHRILQATDYPL